MMHLDTHTIGNKKDMCKRHISSYTVATMGSKEETEMRFYWWNGFKY